MSNSNSNSVAQAASELKQLEKQTEKARLLLAHLQTGLIDAGNKLGGEATLLVEANQQLVLAAIHAQAHAETTARLAELDVLTALPNRMVLLDRFEQAIVVAKRRGTCLALLFLDINDFKHINDTLGHSVGDKVLQHVAHCLTDVVRKADTVSRHGGDEFLILLAEISHMSDATLIADKIHAALIAPYRVGDEMLTLTVSVGISLYPEHGEDAATLIERADLAMYHAKRNGLGNCFYNGNEIVSAGDLEAVESSARMASHKSSAVYRHTYLQEATERLITVALRARDRQAAAEQVLHRQTTLAHELRNPLDAIRKAAALLDDAGTDAPQLQELQFLINHQVTCMSCLLDDLLEVARIVNAEKLMIADASPPL